MADLGAWRISGPFLAGWKAGLRRESGRRKDVRRANFPFVGWNRLLVE